MLAATSDGEGCGAAGSGALCCAVLLLCCEGAWTAFCWAAAWPVWVESALIRAAMPSEAVWLAVLAPLFDASLDAT